mgnify:CR=1 FL=1
MSEITVPSKVEVETLTNAFMDAEMALTKAIDAIASAAKKGDMAAIEAAVFAKKDADSALVRAKNALACATDLVANAGRMRVNVAARDAIKAWLAESAEMLESVSQGTTGFRVTATKGDNGNVSYQVNVIPEVGAITRAPREGGTGGGRGTSLDHHVVGHGTDTHVGSANLLLQFGGAKGAEAVQKAKDGIITKAGNKVPYGYQPDVKRTIAELQKAGYTVTTTGGKSG